MTFAIRNLSVLADARGFTLWHYRDGTARLDDVAASGFFDAAADMLAVGDMVMVSASDGGRLLVVALSGKSIQTAPLLPPAFGVPLAPPEPPAVAAPPAWSVRAVTAVTPLYVLPDGNAVDPRVVLAVEFLPALTCDFGTITTYRDRVLVVSEAKQLVIEFATAAEAIAARDEIIAAINAARGMP